MIRKFICVLLLHLAYRREYRTASDTLSSTTRLPEIKKYLKSVIGRLRYAPYLNGEC
jgi:hypothetical protein